MSTPKGSAIPPGGHNVTMRAVYPKRGPAPYKIDVIVRLHDGRTIKKRRQGPTKQATYNKALKFAEETLATSHSGTWNLSTPIVEYVEDVSRPAIENAGLRPTSLRAYLPALDYLIGDEKGRKYRLKGHTIGSLTSSFTEMERVLLDIRDTHGKGPARHAKTVLSRYILDRLKRDGLIQVNLMKGEKIAGVDDRTPDRPVGTLTREEYNKTIDHLLTRDPDKTRFPGSSTRQKEKPQTVAKHRRAILLTLIQAATGLRINEALDARWGDHVTVTADRVTITVTGTTSKTKRGRTVPILVEEVADRVREMAAAAAPGTPLIPSPGDPTKRWDNGNSGDAVAALYDGLADELEIDTLRKYRSHMWRGTLNTLLADKLPDALRAAFFGHSTAENERSYTGGVDTTPMIDAIHALRTPTDKPT